ncbi:MAG: cyclic nucleotide-gated ion channel/potassium channel family protein [Beijerinckiaceae bacterium]|nr:cyclic nucleotide-gated ion channel/potassium channel family protein [Beijerinckiaceae bacterium]
MSMRAQISDLLDDGSLASRGNAWIRRFMVMLILIGIWCVIQSTDKSNGERLSAMLIAVDRFVLAVFLIEYLLRIWTCPEDIRHREKTPAAARRAYLVSTYGVIDLIAVLPITLLVAQPEGSPWVAAIELLRCAKTLRYSTSLQALLETLLKERGAVLAALLVIAGTAIMAGGIVYALESPGQPEEFDSILSSVWWAIESIVGSSTDELSPETPVGRLMAALLTIFGFLMLALPVGIVGASFESSFRQKDFTISAKMVSRVPLFSNFRPQEIVSIATALRSKRYPAGSTILKKGEIGDEMYFIVDGAVGVQTQNGVLTLRKDAYFGERALIKVEPRNSTITALETTRLLALDKATLNDLIGQRPEIHEELLKTIDAREAKPAAA